MTSPRRVDLSVFLAVIVWLTLSGLLLGWATTAQPRPAALVLVAASVVIWGTGLRAAVLWIRAAGHRADRFGDLPASDLRVAALYCVTDDVDLSAIALSAHGDADIVILDDSRGPATRDRIDRFAAQLGCRILRRPDRVGAKAGNLNHAVAALRGQYDAYLICDSDVVLPAGLVAACSAVLASPDVAVAQAMPVAARGTTWFSRYFGPLLATHLGVTRRGRAAGGVTAFLGRGALVRATAIDDAGGFPTVVAEDLAFTIALRRRGWRVVDVAATFTEDYPVDYRAFRAQMRKTTEGAVELLRVRGWARGIPLRETLDIVIETALVPAAAVAGIVAVVAGTTVAAAGSPPPVWMMVTGATSALLPLLPEAVRRVREHGTAAGVVFALLGGALYASTTFVVLGAALRVGVGRRAVFTVTPKKAVGSDVRERLTMLRPDLVIALLIMTVAVLASGSALGLAAPLLPLVLALTFSVLRVPTAARSVIAVSRVGARI
ncbi:MULTISPECIES: glycosyltransferase family 2 protein [unclassified Microbacterium]|uniref:glycosyltransferase family 2 protein n=1 Tax=unclassified Microbacterium TaxID=2609290 RepID=UPI00386592EF